MAGTKTNGYLPASLLVQWHITGRCNLHCRHCYGEARPPDLDAKSLFAILAQIRALIAELRLRAGHRRIPVHLTVTGGEPLLHRSFFPLLEEFHARRNEFSFAILSNGTFIDAEAAHTLRRLGAGFVQLSVEGGESCHDAIRGAGDFARVVQAATTLRRAEVPVLFSFTAQRSNFREFGTVAALGRQLGVKRVWADRFIPLGGAQEAQDAVLSPAETREFFEIVYRARQEGGEKNRTEISLHRALQFLVGGGRPYRCQAGKGLLTILADGEVVPCRRLPLPVGNLLATPLQQLYAASPLLEQLRAPSPVPGCAGCLYEEACAGGLRCLAQAQAGDLAQRDPGCWLR